MANKSLTETLKRFDEILGQDYQIILSQDSSTEITMGSRNEQIKNQVKESIKDALEACRVGKMNKTDNHSFNQKGFGQRVDGHNQATTQYDENVKSFLGEK